MKYIHYFENVEDFQEHYWGEKYNEPFVSYTVTGETVDYGNVNYNKSEDDKLREIPLTFEILTDGNIMWKVSNTSITKTIEYKKNDGEWTEITSTTGGTSISVVAGDIIQFRGNNTTYSTSTNAFNTFGASTCQFNAKGNIMSLINKTNFTNITTLNDTYIFNGLFRQSKIVSAEKLVLPATTLAYGSYQFMFYGCSNLVNAPALPATTLTYDCYYDMFYNCTSLVNAPVLPAITLGIRCYYNMFYNCTSLVNAPALPATALTASAYTSMFQNCTSLVNAPALPATSLANCCYAKMFYYCTSLVNAPELPATSLANCCYYQMFYSTRLVTAPALPATALTASAYTSMFQNCTSLVNAPALPATTLATACYDNMFYYCTSLVNAPELPATDLTNTYSCYGHMFQGCTSLVNAPTLPATTLGNNCYQYMFNGCTSLTTTQEILPATALTNCCYYDMFDGCTSLTTAPELPATTLVVGCYGYMFFNCRSLNYIKCLATTGFSANNCLQVWVRNVASSGTFVKNASASIGSGGWPRSESGIPTSWTVQDAT